jgi:hypothetical protein
VHAKGSWWFRYNKPSVDELSVEAMRPWKEFDIQVPPLVHEIFEAANSSIVDDGASTFF